MIQTLLEGGVLWIVGSCLFVFGWLVGSWFHKTNDCMEYYELVDVLATFLELDEGKLYYGPLFHDRVRSALDKVQDNARVQDNYP